MPILALLTRSAEVDDTDLEDVQPTIAHGVPGCTGGFDIVAAAATTSTVAVPHVEVGDDGKEPGDLGVARREGGGERRVRDDKPIDGVVLMDGGVARLSSETTIVLPIYISAAWFVMQL